MIRDREGNWHYRFEFQGREFSGNTGLAATERNCSAAKKIEASERGKVKALAAENRLSSRSISFVDAAAEFVTWCEQVEYRGKPNTWKRISSSFHSLVTFFGTAKVADIAPGDLERYKTWRLVTHAIKEVSLRHDLHNFSLFCQYARKQRWITGDPMEDISIPSDAEATRDNILTPEMENAYFKRAFEVQDRNGRRNLYDFGRLMILQGCRPEELMVLRQEHIDLEKRQMRIVAGKSRAAKRTLALCQESIEILTSRIDGMSPWVFPSDRKAGRPIAKLQGPHDRVCRESGVSCVIYDLRHTFATRMIESGIDVMALAKILGHANLRTIQRYVHLTDEHTRKAMEQYDAAQSRRKLKVVGR